MFLILFQYWNDNFRGRLQSLINKINIEMLAKDLKRFNKLILD